MKKIKQITGLLILGLFVFQVAKAADIKQQGVQIFNDTTIKKDSILPQQEQAINDPKQSFKNLFKAKIYGSENVASEMIHLDNPYVQTFMKRNKRDYLRMKEWGKAIFTMMDVILSQHGVPKELKYLAVIESSLNPYDRSIPGAVGPWAFMPETAAEYGLKITSRYDERTDYAKSTHAAARMLTDLYAKYKDWLLVIAAYNSGPGWVNKAIRKHGSNDFWTIQYSLPLETRNHVKKFIAAHYIFEGEGGLTTVTKAEAKEAILNEQEAITGTKLTEEEMENSIAYKITGRFIAAVIIKTIELDKNTFDRYNPNFENDIAVNGKYELRLPKQKMNIFISKRYEILDESVQSLLNQTSTGTK